MSELYLPNKKIVIASSFEGVVNNGAKECGVISLAAYGRMLASGRLRGWGSFADKDPDMIMRAFLALRPLVAVADDYLTVLMLIQRYPTSARLLVDGKNRSAKEKEEDIAHFQAEFENIKSRTLGQRAEFLHEFKAERKARQETDMNAWLRLQEPFIDTVAQLKELNMLKTFDPTTRAQTGGFKLYYVTSKDEASTYLLCTVYGELGGPLEGMLDSVLLSPDENWADYIESMKSCLIQRDCIIGNETVTGSDKLAQMTIVADREGLDPSNVWRVQDRFDRVEVETLRAAGFNHQFIVKGGYAFPDDYQKAENAGIEIFDRKDMAQALANYAHTHGF